MTRALIEALVACHRHGTRLKSGDWVNAVRDEVDAYAVQEGVAAALGWALDRWKSGGAGTQGPFSHSPVNPVAGTAVLGIEAEVALRLGRAVTPVWGGDRYCSGADPSRAAKSETGRALS